MSSRLILASASPRRSELLARAGIRFDVVPSDVDETVQPDEPPTSYVARVARAKADAVRAAWPHAWVLAADTSVVAGGAILGKAADAAEAAGMLRDLSGRGHSVLTATCLVGPDGQRAELVTETEVDFRALSEREIASYVAGDEWRGKAGAYAAQGQAAAFIVAIRGSFTNVIGLPLAETLGALEAFGVARPEYAP
jgi:septum formation protein